MAEDPEERDGVAALRRRLDELAARNRRLVAQADALRRELEAREAEVVRLTRLLQAARSAGADAPSEG